MTHRVKIDDGYVEWGLDLDGGGDLSIQDILNAIVNNTVLTVEKERHNKPHDKPLW